VPVLLFNLLCVNLLSRFCPVFLSIRDFYRLLLFLFVKALIFNNFTWKLPVYSLSSILNFESCPDVRFDRQRILSLKNRNLLLSFIGLSINFFRKLIKSFSFFLTLSLFQNSTIMFIVKWILWVSDILNLVRISGFLFVCPYSQNRNLSVPVTFLSVGSYSIVNQSFLRFWSLLSV